MFFRKIFSLLSFLLIILFSTTNGQILTPVTWDFNIEETANGTYKVVMHAEMEEKWHVYGMEIEGDDGPVPTEVIIDENPDIELIGKVKDGGNLVTEHDPVFDMMISFYDKTVTFTQEFRALKDTEVKGSVYFMTCNDKTCIPPEYEDFSFNVKASPVKEIKTEEVSVSSGEIAGDKVEIYDPVTWDFKIEEGEAGSYFLIASADIEETWHVYARVLESDEGPIATEFGINENDQIELIGEIQDRGELKTEYDPNFMMNLSYYDTHVEFAQEFKLKGEGAKVSGYVYYMTCDDEKCLPPEEVTFNLEVGNTDIVVPEDGSTESEVSGDLSFWSTFLKGFFGGFLALLTPCVFPMIPLTVSFFTKQSKTRAKGISNAVMYGASIIGIYVLLGYGVTAIFGADALNALSTNVWFNLAFFVLLTVFAISFFGAFEITLPSSWVNKADMASDKGGIMGIFFMAFTLSLVSFSCTGPIIGTLLVDAAVNGGVAGPLVGMFGFSLALALPFGVFAAFPGWLNSLPSSGGWLNSVKVVLGFLELAFAFKFLSNADLVVQAGLLKRELFIAIWIAIFALMTAYLLGFYSLPHDSKTEKIGVGRLMFAIVSLMFTIYLIPGIWGAPLQIISGFPPPKFYSESPNGLAGGSMIVTENTGGEIVGEPEHCPHQLNCFHDYDEGMAYAKEVGKPVMLDFTGWACVNCRKMEEQVWSDPSVLKILREDVVLISLYVDEKIELPKEEQREVVIGKKTKMLKTVGNKWSYFQATKYNTNSQPYYVILDHDENTLNGSAAYDPDVVKFRNWLLEGISKFKGDGVASSH